MSRKIYPLNIKTTPKRPQFISTNNVFYNQNIVSLLGDENKHFIYKIL